VSSPTSSSVYVTSTEGTYSVINKAAGVAKKLGQRKRPVNAKTSKRKVPIAFDRYYMNIHDSVYYHFLEFNDIFEVQTRV
jgi:hypothetical protein